MENKSSNEVIFRNQKCPICKENTFNVTQKEYEIEFYGPVILLTALCEKCSFTYRDVLLLTSSEPSIMKLKITNEELNATIIKSSTATILIPELKVKITPGPASEGYITTVEGILNRIEDVALSMLSSLKGLKREKCMKFLEELQKARNGEKEFTFIIKDPYGKSIIIPKKKDKVIKRRLSKKEIEKLTKVYKT
ncbi:MAG: ZPR1 zinc finger domain-containing protein [Candidatus Bathyarchaeia archaeon]|nr:ZPR1 zinc finger domain-containing protein [Candidatus Bathyarchaeota archaeon]